MSTTAPDEQNLPVIPPLPPGMPPVPDRNPAVAKCGECQLVLRRTMHYVCPNERCPVWTRAFCSLMDESVTAPDPAQLRFPFAAD